MQNCLVFHVEHFVCTLLYVQFCMYISRQMEGTTRFTSAARVKPGLSSSAWRLWGGRGRVLAYAL